MPKFGGQLADVAAYEGKEAVALVEVKIIDEGRKLEGVVRDWGKIRLLQQFPSLGTVIGDHDLEAPVSQESGYQVAVNLRVLGKQNAHIIVTLHRGGGLPCHEPCTGRYQGT